MGVHIKGIDLPKEGEWLEVIIKPTKEVIVDTIRYRDNALLKTEYAQAYLEEENDMGVNCEADFCQWYDLDLDDCSLEYIEDSDECNRAYGVSKQWWEENDDSNT